MDREELYERFVLRTDRPEDYVAWAEGQLLAGSESTDVAFLASLGLEKPLDTREVRETFARCLRKLGIAWPEGEEARREYSARLCEKVLDGEADPASAVGRLARLDSLFPESLYGIWSELAEDLEALDSEEGPYYHSGLTRESLAEHVRRAARQHLRLMAAPLPENFAALKYCAACGTLGEPITAGERIACSSCGSGWLLWMNRYEDRETYLSIVEATGWLAGSRP